MLVLRKERLSHFGILKKKFGLLIDRNSGTKLHTRFTQYKLIFSLSCFVICKVGSHLRACMVPREMGP
jgi:hypothetical protein